MGVSTMGFKAVTFSHEASRPGGISASDIKISIGFE